MNADFDDEYCRKRAKKMQRKHFLHDCLYPTIIAGIIVTLIIVFAS